MTALVARLRCAVDVGGDVREAMTYTCTIVTGRGCLHCTSMRYTVLTFPSSRSAELVTAHFDVLGSDVVRSEAINNRSIT